MEASQRSMQYPCTSAISGGQTAFPFPARAGFACTSASEMARCTPAASAHSMAPSLRVDGAALGRSSKAVSGRAHRTRGKGHGSDANTFVSLVPEVLRRHVEDQ